MQLENLLHFATIAAVLYATNVVMRGALKLWQQGYLKAGPNAVLVVACAGSALAARGPLVALAVALAVLLAVSLGAAARRESKTFAGYIKDKAFALIAR